MPALVKRLVAVNANGLRIGDSHPRSKLSNAEVDEMRDIYENGECGCTRLARKFGISKTLAYYICTYQRRVQTIEGHKVIVLGTIEELTP